MLIAGMLLNSVLIFRTEYSNGPYEDVTVSDYNRCYEALEKQSGKKAAKRFKSLADAESSSRIWTDVDAKMHYAYQAVAKEIQYAGSFDDYYNQKKSQYEDTKELSIFGTENAYDKRQSRKTFHVLQRFLGTKVSIAPSRGVKIIFENIGTDVLLIFQILLVCVWSFMRKKENGYLDFMRTQYHGRMGFYWMEAGVVFLVTGFMTGCMYFSNALCGWYIYGLGPLDRSLQSVSGYIGTGVGGSVFHGIVVFFLLKWLFLALLSSVVLFLMVCCSGAGVYVGLTIWLGVSALLYTAIDTSSWLSGLKNMNMIAWLHTGRMLQRFRCVNFFGYPVSYLKTAAVVSVCFIFLLCLIGSVLYSGQKIASRSEGKGKIKRITDQVWTVRFGARKNLFFMEGKKIFVHEKVLWMLILLIPVVVYFAKPLSSIYTDGSDVYYKQYVDRIQGPYSDEKILQILKWKNALDYKLTLKKREMKKAKTLAQRELTAEEYNVTDEEVTGLQSLYDHAVYVKKTHGDFYYTRGYEMLTGGTNAGSKDALYALVCILLMIVMLSGIQSRDAMTGMDRLLQCGVQGRRELKKYQMLYGILITSLIFVGIYGSWYSSVLRASGFAGLGNSVTSMEHIPSWFAGVSVGGYLCMISVIRYLGCITVALIEMRAATELRSRISTMLVMAGFVGLPLVMYILGVNEMKYVLLNPLLLGNVW